MLLLGRVWPLCNEAIGGTGAVSDVRSQIFISILWKDDFSGGIKTDGKLTSWCCRLLKALSARWPAARHVDEISNGRGSLRIAMGAMEKQRKEEKSADSIACVEISSIKSPQFNVPGIKDE